MKKLLCLLLVAGCSTVEWDKPGATPQSVDADLRSCTTASQAIPSLPAARTTANEVRTGPGGASVPAFVEVNADQRLEQAQRVQGCMQGRGYVLTRKPAGV